ncbi:MAG: flavin monoamine oxidase family protein [Opitutaceae bacterium]
MSRRQALKLAGAAVAGLMVPKSFGAVRPAKKVIVAGAGITGLCCAYELMRRGHDATVLEASDRTGGHVLTAFFQDGLYADLGAEQCTAPGYELYRGYVKEFGLELLPFRRHDNLLTFIEKKPYTAEMLADRKVLGEFGFNGREVDYIAGHNWHEGRLLYMEPYLDKFTDEYQPFGVELDELDAVSISDFMQRAGASAAALRFFGGKHVSALQEMWRRSILKKRGRPAHATDNLFRIRGGNQRLTDAFAGKLGQRVRLGCPISRIKHGDSGVTVYFREPAGEKMIEGDFLVNTIALPTFRNIPVEPGWPAEKAWVLDNVGYNMQSRVVFQCRTRFWKQDGISPNITASDIALRHVFECATEIPGERGILMSSCQPGITARQSLEALRQYYPGRRIDVENVSVKEWYRETWAPMCERLPFRMNQLAKFWPVIMQAHSRIHFAGAYADNYTSGMEAATRSAHRVARQIDEA